MFAGNTGANGDPGPNGKAVTFELIKTGETTLSRTFNTDYTNGDASIFSGGAGAYTLRVSGAGPLSTAYYNISIAANEASISAVPVPAAGLLLLGGLGGLGGLRAFARRRKAA